MEGQLPSEAGAEHVAPPEVIQPDRQVPPGLRTFNEIESQRDLDSVRAVLKLYSDKTPSLFAYLPPTEAVLADPGMDCTFSLRRGHARLVLFFDQLAIGIVFKCS